MGARRMDVKLKPSNGTAHTLTQEGCTDMARHGVLSQRIALTGRCSSEKWKKIYNAAKLSGSPASTLLAQINSQAVDD